MTQPSYRELFEAFEHVGRNTSELLAWEEGYKACKASLTAAEERAQKLEEALNWFEGYFRANIDGGGNHSCPWCYHRKDEQQPWGDIKHTPDCVIGNALAAFRDAEKDGGV